MAAKQWEYKMERFAAEFKPDFDEEAQTRLMNKRSAQGWELVSVLCDPATTVYRGFWKGEIHRRAVYRYFWKR